MDDETFKKELLTKLDRIQSLLSYLCGAAKASEERAQAALRVPEKQETRLPADGRSLLQDEMQDDYHQALQKWHSTRQG
ncbi:hypothetical protein GMLC_00410 [Geomonas limicola]|uniref:Uncharacterized protein n=1 Tax=Geomonas limicola TaxID=2740186 RepID=A0A6V8N1W5_9BACT|nr:hypothetical protein [Geomonas limicola]GFO66462.1 hypothetical protein GMLC_00410 [Geomonas limicola]